MAIMLCGVVAGLSAILNGISRGFLRLSSPIADIIPRNGPRLPKFVMIFALLLPQLRR